MNSTKYPVTAKLKAAGLWQRTCAAGNTYFAGRLGGVKILILDGDDFGGTAPCCPDGDGSTLAAASLSSIRARFCFSARAKKSRASRSSVPDRIIATAHARASSAI